LTAWPRWGDTALAHVATVDPSDLVGFEHDVPLPDHGLVSFFYEAEEQQAWGFLPEHRDGWRVVLSDPATAVERARPAEATTFPRIDLVAEQTLTFPGWEEAEAAPWYPPHRRYGTGFLDRRRKQKDDRRREAAWAVGDAWGEVIRPTDRGNHQIGGWPRLVQNPIWDECHLVSQGLPIGNTEDWERAHRTPRNGSKDDWRLLLQLDTDDDAGWMWGDVGTLFYAVDSTRPPMAAITEAWMVLQCG
jgi:uncharacterized protein YwqG